MERSVHSNLSQEASEGVHPSPLVNEVSVCEVSELSQEGKNRHRIFRGELITFVLLPEGLLNASQRSFVSRSESLGDALRHITKTVCAMVDGGSNQQVNLAMQSEANLEEAGVFVTRNRPASWHLSNRRPGLVQVGRFSTARVFARLAGRVVWRAITTVRRRCTSIAKKWRRGNGSVGGLGAVGGFTTLATFSSSLATLTAIYPIRVTLIVGEVARVWSRSRSGNISMSRVLGSRMYSMNSSSLCDLLAKDSLAVSATWVYTQAPGDGGIIGLVCSSAAIDIVDTTAVGICWCKISDTIAANFDKTRRLFHAAQMSLRT